MFDMLANCDGSVHLPILHLPQVEFRYKLQEILRRATGSLQKFYQRSYIVI